MENKRYDNIEYDDNWKTTSSVTAQRLNGYNQYQARYRQDSIKPYDNDNYYKRSKRIERQDRENYNNEDIRHRRDVNYDERYDVEARRNRELNHNDYELYDDEYYNYQENYIEDYTEKKDKQKSQKTPLTGTQRIIKFQLILCVIIGVSIFAIQYIMPDLFNQIMQIYKDLYNASLVITDKGNIF